jgi:hypothetical protein
VLTQSRSIFVHHSPAHRLTQHHLSLRALSHRVLRLLSPQPVTNRHRSSPAATETRPRRCQPDQLGTTEGILKGGVGIVIILALLRRKDLCPDIVPYAKDSLCASPCHLIVRACALLTLSVCCMRPLYVCSRCAGRISYESCGRRTVAEPWT